MGYAYYICGAIIAASCIAMISVVLYYTSKMSDASHTVGDKTVRQIENA